MTGNLSTSRWFFYLQLKPFKVQLFSHLVKCNRIYKTETNKFLNLALKRILWKIIYLLHQTIFCCNSEVKRFLFEKWIHLAWTDLPTAIANKHLWHFESIWQVVFWEIRILILYFLYRKTKLFFRALLFRFHMYRIKRTW
jgi:hypothetical protein